MRGSGESKLLGTCLVIAYFLVLYCNYRDVISPRFEYLSFIYVHRSLASLVPEILIAVAPIWFLPTRASCASDYGVMCVYLLMYIPCAVMTSAMHAEFDHNSMMLLIAILLGMSIVCAVPRIQIPLSGSRVAVSERAFMLVVLGLGLAAIAVMGKEFGFRFQLHSLDSVYEQRDDFKAGLESARYSRYVIGVLQNVVVGFLAGYGLTFRKWFYVGMAMAVSLYIFSVTGLKSSFSSVIYIICAYVGVQFFRNVLLNVMLCFCLAVVLLGWLLVDYPGFNVVNELFTRRILLIQGLLMNYFVDVFSYNDPLYLRHSLLRFMGQPAIVDPEGYVGELYFNGVVHANANFWADGYMNGRWIGVLISSFCVGAFFALVDALGRRLNLVFVVTSFSMIVLLITQTGITKIIGTHGGLVFLVLIYFAGGVRAFLNSDSARGVYESDHS